ncbi:MAG: pantoate--beta-alanine ligase [Flammeovirgaceae bacterium]|nr:pantoate--beta-alanine ligase [Flammeovirgaceae bacterium]
MRVFNEIEPLKAFLRKEKIDSNSVGFVPTMGALHQGHLSLIEASRVENSITVCSIFVNPTQFNNPADLAKYPRTLEADKVLLERAKCDILFCPETSQMYSSQSQVTFDFGKLDKMMEGHYRPGHFSGVALVVSKLLHIVSPDRAYFGQKDYQQFKIIEKLVADLKFDVSLRCMLIKRETDGLAMSSRNARLSNEQRSKAIVFYQSLLEAKALLQKGNSVKRVYESITKNFERIGDVKLEYFELADTTNLTPTENVSDNAILLIAGYVGEIRLIDNLLMKDAD